jgi:2-polyprenyl-6-methoxyphenol hydroxylase-like FAD-dependent oxidoreductase
MLGLLMARAGVDVVVLEKHGDFMRDFRGDTIHPSTLLVMHELGLLEPFLALPHEKVQHLSAQIGSETLTLADFSHLPGPCRFMAFMPQWDFLDFLADEACRSPLFTLRMNASVTGLVEDGTRISGVMARTPSGPLQVRARVVIAADGRNSVARTAAGLEVEDVGAPIDVLWFSLPRRPDDRADTFGSLDGGKLLILINRGEYWQCGFVIEKGTLEQRRRAGLAVFRDEIAALQPRLADRVGLITSWDDVKLLPVTVDRLRKWWRPGLLCIGDAAHAMSPVGGVGVNLAIQDAVATANILAPHLRAGMQDDDDLAAVQRRREWPMRATQHLQGIIQNQILNRPPEGLPTRLPLSMRLIAKLPLLRRLPARLFGLGVRPEHVQHRAP